MGKTIVFMRDTMAHGGPDDAGFWIDPDRGVALGHRRLSIIDPTPAGRQPMFSACERYAIVFNGEIYNHLEIRQELGTKAAGWRGHSDTETLISAIASWGVEKALHQCVGMFAFTVWDREQRCLILARDRFGEKPLYYGWQGDVFLFGSELKALCAHPAFRWEIDRDAVASFMRYGYVPTPYSIYKGIRKLPPGTWLTIQAGESTMQPIRYWSINEMFERGCQEPFIGDEAEALEELERLLRRSVAGQMIADVPLGVFLSGGVDSSTVTALMQVQSSKPIRTFSIGFREDDYNEAQHATAIARHLGTDHTEFCLTEKEAMEVIPLLPDIYDEPFSDSSQIPTYLVSRMARRHVTVALTGDAGDELFGGYTRHFWASRHWPRLLRIPRLVRLAASKALYSLTPARWNSIYSTVLPVLPSQMQFQHPGEKLQKVAGILGAEDGFSLYRSLISRWTPESVVREAEELQRDFSSLQPALQGLPEQMMALDVLTYLPDDVLAKVDRAAMATSLEARIPLLDHRVAEFAWRLPVHMKIRAGQGKWILRQVLYKYVSKELIERPKMGFGVPIGSWLRGTLREWAEEMLDESRLRREGFFNPEPIRRRWNEHKTGKRNWQDSLWSVLMFQSWLEKWGDH